MKLNRLSLCMIVKDEEKRVSRCLASVKNIVDEMIIVDTGSTDRTKEICRSFGAHLYDFKWTNSFADARNYGVKRATGDWILWLDADEEVDEADACKLRDVLDLDDYDLMAIHLINYYGKIVDKDKVFTIAHYRLFRNHKGFTFINRIHETIDVQKVLTTPEDQHRIGELPIKVHHYGYMDDVTEEKEKSKRNLNMLEQELEQEDYSPWIHYHIAAEYDRHHNYQKSFEHVNAAILQFVLQGYTPPALVYKLKYSVLINLGSFEGAWPAIKKAIELYPDYVDLHFYMGVILYCKTKYVQSLEAFERCLKLGEDNLNYLTLKGVGSFQAMYYKGLCHEQLGQIKKAIFSYVDAILDSNTFADAIEALLKLLDQQSVSLDSYLKPHYDDKAIRQLTSIIKSYENRTGK